MRLKFDMDQKDRPSQLDHPRLGSYLGEASYDSGSNALSARLNQARDLER